MNVTTGKCATTAIVGCNKIETTGLCAQCRPGYKVNDLGTGCNVSCNVRNCNNCSNNVCSSCVLGFNLTTGTVNGSIVQVCSLFTCTKANCTLCDQTGACVQCSSGYFLNTTAGTCYTNCTAYAGCINCAAGSTICN